jgi:uncharacterized protein YjbI with pentapeptide repeats
VSPAQLSFVSNPSAFGEGLVGGPQKQKTFTIKNTGGSPSSTPQVQLAGTDASQWQIGTNGCTTGLKSGSSCTVTVDFAPTKAGPLPTANGSPAYNPVADAASLEATAGPGGSAQTGLTGTANWGCVGFSQGCDLVDTTVANAGSANLNGADLFFASLEGTLSGINLSDAFMVHSSLDYAFLSNANLTGANAAHSFFEHTTLSGANLTGTNLNGANLNDATLTSANLTDASIANSSLSNAFLQGTNLTGASLSGAFLTDATLIETNLTNANLNGAVMLGATFNGVTWSNTTCPDGTNSNSDGNTCAGHLVLIAK